MSKSPSRPRVESLESRTLLALAAGFESVKVTRVVTEVATSMEFAPSVGDGVVRLFVADSNNRQIRLLKDGVLQPTPALTFTTSEVDRSRERGINGIAFDPDFADNKFVYLYYTKPDPAKPNVSPSAAVTRLVRYTMNAGNDTINKSSAVVLLDNIPNLNGIHNGGALRFGPDGMLYLAVGDGGVSGDAQSLDKFGGKVLRLNVKSPSSLAPSDNPFYDASNGITARDYVWAYGLRNPFTGNFKPGSGTFYVNDVGGSKWEEINSVQRGKNYGWPDAEGVGTNAAYTNPVYAYTHYPNGTSQPRVGAAITGGAFYAGGQFPASYQGRYFFADQVRKFIKVFNPATGQVSDFHTNDDAILDVLDLDVAPDGTLWTLSTGGNIRRIRYVGTANRAPVASASADRTSGTLPLTVNFSGAGSTDADGDALSYSWNFGDGTSATGRDVRKTYSSAGTYIVVLTVSDGAGGSDTSEPIQVIAGSRAPTGSITSPASGSTYGGGQAINFAGAGTDPEDGTLPASAFAWTVVFHHDDHTHPFGQTITGVKSGSFVIPTVGEQDPDQWYRVHLTVTDSDGVNHSTFRDVVPRTTTITLASNVGGAQVTLDGEPRTTTANVLGVEGMVRTLGVPSPQTVGGKAYAFTAWSDGGARVHDITTPVNNTTYTATLRETSTPAATVLRAADDAYVRDGASANTNFGGDATLFVKKSNTAGNTRDTHLRFGLSNVAVGTGQSVKLRLFARLGDTENNHLGLGVYAVSNTTWSETGITWNSRPSSGATALDSETISGTTGRWYEWDVTNYVRGEKSAGRNAVAFALKRGTATNTLIWINADEASSNRPELVVSAPSTTPSAKVVTTSTASYVRGGTYANTNFGSDPELHVKQAGSASNVREGYVKFDLSGVSTIASAKLRLFGRLHTASSTGVQVAAYKADNNWTEGGLTFNNRPATSGGVRATVTVGGTSGAWYEWDLTALLQAEKAAGRNTVTIALKGTTATDPYAIFNADGAASNTPQLVVTS